MLRSEVGSANFFFINPAGVAFGEGGSVDVPASFHLSTAEELRFVDGTVLSASTTATSTLSMAAPEAFGFLGNNAGSINIEGGSIVIGSGSGSPDNITLSANSLFVSETANVTTPGAIRIAAVGDAEASIDLETGAQSPLEGELLVNGLVGLVPPADAPNNILAEAGTIEITGPESGLATGAEGTTQVISRDLVVSDGGDIFSQGSVDIQVLNQVSVLDGGQISTIAFGEEGAGVLEISAANLLIDGLGSDSLTGVFSTGLMGTTGDTGGIDVAVTETAIIQDGGLIRSANAGSGDAGNIVFSAGELIIDGRGSPAGIFNDNVSSEGLAGNVSVTIEEIVTIQSGGQIRSESLSGQDAGDLVLTADQLLIDGQGSDVFTGISSAASAGVAEAGNVEVTIVEMATIQNGGLIRSDSFSDGGAGNIALSADQLIIDGQDSDSVTGLSSSSFVGAGEAGNVEVTIAEMAAIQNGGLIRTDSSSEGDGGSVVLSAGQLVIDSQSSGSTTGISSSSFVAAGAAGNVEVTIAEMATIQNGGLISTNSLSEGDAGTVVLSADRLLVDGQGSENFTGISSDRVAVAGTGAGGTVEVAVADTATITDGGQVRTVSSGAGEAGLLTLSARQLLIDGQGSDIVFGTGIISDAGLLGVAGTVEVTVAELATILDGGRVSSTTFGEGDGGGVSLSVGQLFIDGTGNSSLGTGILSQAASDSTGNAGDIEVAVDGVLTLQNEAIISSSSDGTGDAGNITLSAGGLLVGDTQPNIVAATGILSSTTSSGAAGFIEVTVDELAILQNGGFVSSSTFGEGDAGNVTLSAQQLMIDRQGADRGTGIFSDAFPTSTGNAGSIDVDVAEMVTVQGGGAISSGTASEGNAGNIVVSTGQLTIDSQSSDGATGLLSNATTGSTGNAGSVAIVADVATVQNGGSIATGTAGAGVAGNIMLTAEQLVIDGQGAENNTGLNSSTFVGSTGNAGSIVVDAQMVTIQAGGIIQSDTVGEGNAGNILVSAEQLLIDSRDGTVGITSVTDSTGDAGTIEIAIAETATIQSGGAILSSTFGEGNAGNIVLSAGQLVVSDGEDDVSSTLIFSGTGSPESSGSAANVVVTVVESATLQNVVMGSDSIGSGDAGSVLIETESGAIVISDDSNIGSSALFDGSDSGSVVIDTGDSLTIDDSNINTESLGGEAGPITITAAVLNTNDVEITTTTESLTADGGDINISSDVFTLQETVIQANATSGEGGVITVDSSVVPFGNQFNTQLDTPLSLDDPELASFGNVAQAVAPTGVSVPPEINSPEVDITGALSDLDSDLGEAPTIGADHVQ